MRFLRALSAALLLVISLAFVAGDQIPALASDVEEAEQAADAARQRAAEADSLLSDAAARRASVENELAATLIRLSEINAELTRVSVELENLRQTLARTDVELQSINQALAVKAVDAYVRAVALPAASIMGTDDAETAIVAASSVDGAIDSNQAEMGELTVKRRQLKRVRSLYRENQERVTQLQEEADAEADHLENLLVEADAALATAVASARTADAEYRQSLDRVDAARARQAENRRQERQSTPTTTTMVTAITTAPTTRPAEPPATSTPTPDPVGGGPFVPSVERWRPLTEAYFIPGRVDEALAVMQCESYGDPAAYNPYSGAGGLFQFLPSTWATLSPRAGFSGASVFDAEANIATAAWLTDYYTNRGSHPWSAWTCRP